MDGKENIDDDAASKETSKPRTETIDLGGDNSLVVDIPDALSEREKVKFSVRTRTTMPTFKKRDMQVTRLHEEFVWLHDRYVENDEYAGIIIPPTPPRPDFDASREKLQRLGEESEGNFSKEEFQKMKSELEAEYLATFKKTVAMHEVFLQRLGAHPILRNDANFRVFLEYEGELNVRGQNKKEKFLSFFDKVIAKPVNEVYLNSTQKDNDDYFDQQKTFLSEYLGRSREAASKADMAVILHKELNNSMMSLSSTLSQVGFAEPQDSSMRQFFTKLADIFDKVRKVESRLSADEDLKMSDTIRYYYRDADAAKDLLIRRLTVMQNFEGSAKTVEALAAKGKDTRSAEEAKEKWHEKFTKLSDAAREELKSFRARRIVHYRRNMIDYVELQIKHAKNIQQLLRAASASLKLDAEE